MSESGDRAGAEGFLARVGLANDDAVVKAAVGAAARALTPFAHEAARSVVGWAAGRWPDFTRETLLPSLLEAVGADQQGPRERAAGETAGRRPTVDDTSRAATLAAVALAALAAAGAWYRR